MPTNDEKREAAMAYLKARRIHVLDGLFTPTPPPATDVRATIARYRLESVIEKVQKVRKLK